MAFQDYIPMFIRQVLNDPPKFIVTNTRWNELWNLIITQGDSNSEVLKDLCDEFANVQETAETADTNASEALDTAGTALTNSIDAVNTANTADTNAATALNKATQVEGDYTALKPILQQAVADAQAAAEAVADKADVAYVDQVAENFTLGVIPDHTIGYSKLTETVGNDIGTLQSDVGTLQTDLTSHKANDVQVTNEGQTEPPHGLPKCKYDATATPTVNDDTSEGYSVGSEWQYDGTIYKCVDATEGAAVWLDTDLTSHKANFSTYQEYLCYTEIRGIRRLI